MSRRIALAVALLVVAAAGLGLVSSSNPRVRAIMPPCVFKKVTGLHCPGCGSTRATRALLHLDVPGAFRMNPLLVLILPFLVAGIALDSLAWLLGDRYRGPRVRIPHPAGWIIFGIMICYWGLRNIPAWPFNLLAPH